MGLDELLRVLQEETALEERRLREECAREAARIVDEARTTARQLRAAALGRRDEALAARVKGARDAAGRERDRALLLEERRQLELLRAEALARLPEAVTDADVERLVAEVMREAGPVAAVLVVDPGAEAAARRALAALGPAVPPGVEVASRRRGGVELVTGTLVLDDTVAGRLERAWPRAEPELARILFSEG